MTEAVHAGKTGASSTDRVGLSTHDGAPMSSALEGPFRGQSHYRKAEESKRAGAERVSETIAKPKAGFAGSERAP